MTIDPYLIGTAIFAPASVVCALGWLGAAKSARIAWETADSVQANVHQLANEYLIAKHKLARLEAAEKRRKDHLKAIGRKGQAASVAAKNAKRDAATKKTMFDFKNTNLRPREEVVAEIEAQRGSAAASA